MAEMEGSSLLADAMASLRIEENEDFDLDSILDMEISGDRKANPKVAATTTPEEAARKLAEIHLPPSATFSGAWLSKLQQRWEPPKDYGELFKIAPTFSRTVTRFTRQGLEGRIVGYENVTVPASNATAKNSISTLRKPAARTDFVRGGVGCVPFAPGGLESISVVADLEDGMRGRGRSPTAAEQATAGSKLERVIKIADHDGLLKVAPGMSRGIEFAAKKAAAAETKDADDVEQLLSQDPEKLPARTWTENVGDGQQHSGNEVDGDDEPREEEEIDAILPVEFPSLEPRGILAAAKARIGDRAWAHVVEINRPMTNFHELVPEMAREWPFELDTFQKQAVYHLENGDSVFVAAHTSAGKTVVAEYAIALASKHMTKAIYTSPIKALSNQKFRDFRQSFGEVGIITGDVQINPEANCLIMTTEVLRSMLYRGADLIRDVEFVIFDEVHYVNDSERGVVWEEVIIMLPAHVSLILLSATVPNTYEFASWVGRTKKKDIYIISTPKRPIPLEQYLWAGKDMYKIIEGGKFSEKGWKEASTAMQRGRGGQGDGQAQRGNKSGGGGGRGDGQAQRGNNRGGGGGGGRGDGQAQRGNNRGGGGPAQRGRGGGPPRASHAPGHMGRGGRTGGATSAAQDRTLWVHLVQFLKKRDLLPACIFVFSKKRCEENSQALANQDFSTAKEKSATHMTIEKSIARLKPEDRVLPQIARLRELLSRGIAVHHGGLLPIVKELVEILFAQGLVKVLFATETFAVGLNLPTRTVVFSGTRKHDGTGFRDLLPGEFTQMAGRAGRRGLDAVGTVVIVPRDLHEPPPVGPLKTMMLGEPSKLRSQFRLTYHMILNLLRVEALKIEEMIKRSFSEHATQQLLPAQLHAVKTSEAELAKLRRDPCDVCDKDLDQCHGAAREFRALTTGIYAAALATPIGRRLFCQGRLVVLRQDGMRKFGFLLGEGLGGGGGGGGGGGRRAPNGEPAISVLVIRPDREDKDDTDLLPFLPEFRLRFTGFPSRPARMYFKVHQVPVDDIECLTVLQATEVVPHVFRGGAELRAADAYVHALSQSWVAPQWEEASLDKLRNLVIQELTEKRRAARHAILSCEALRCPQFLKHFSACHDQWVIRDHIDQLRRSLSDQNLQLVPDYEQRLAVLRDLDYVDESSRVQLKGKVAAEIHSADELVLTEVILDNVLAEYEPAEVAALLSAFVFQEKVPDPPVLTERLERGKTRILEIAEKIVDAQVARQVVQQVDAANELVRFGLAEVVYEWARGMTFKNIMDLTEVLEGTIVRTITRLNETCREVKNAARIIGDPDLFRKMEVTQELIKRDITAVASLYM